MTLPGRMMLVRRQLSKISAMLSSSSPRPGAGAEYAWAHLWFAIERYPWSTLAIVPASSAHDALHAARLLAEAGELYRGNSVDMLDATRATSEVVSRLGSSAPVLAVEERALIVAVDSPLVNPAAIAVTRLVDAAVLAVPVGTARVADARRVVELIGRDRFIGSIAVPPVSILEHEA